MRARSLADPEGFWGEASEGIAWHRRWDRVLDSRKVPYYRWFAGGELDTCYNAVDRQIELGRGEKPALICDSRLTGVLRALTCNATVLCEGKPVGTPDAGAFWQVIAQHGVGVMFTAPTAFRAIEKEDAVGEPLREYDLARFRDRRTLLDCAARIAVRAVLHTRELEEVRRCPPFADGPFPHAS